MKLQLITSNGKIATILDADTGKIFYRVLYPRIYEQTFIKFNNHKICLDEFIPQPDGTLIYII